MANIKKAVAYCRVSTEEQASSGISLEAQATKLRALAFAQDVELSDVIVDAGISAKTLARPGMGRLLKMVRAGEVDRVYIAKLDRMTRSIRDLVDMIELFQRKHVALMSASESLDTSSAAGRLTLNLLGVIAQWEREQTAERTSAALQHMRAGGQAYNHCPYGFSREGDALVPDHQEQGVIARIQALRSAGLSLRQIAATLNGDGVPTKKGKRWQAKSIADTLRLNRGLEWVA